MHCNVDAFKSFAVRKRENAFCSKNVKKYFCKIFHVQKIRRMVSANLFPMMLMLMLMVLMMMMLMMMMMMMPMIMSVMCGGFLSGGDGR